MLAGGAGSRLGGAKATAPLGGRPLIAWPLAALRAVLADVVVVAKASTALPAGMVAADGAFAASGSTGGAVVSAAPGSARAASAVWVEPDEPRHPLAGIVHALRSAEGRDVLVCAVDLPFVTPQTVRALLAAPPPDGAVLAGDIDGRPQPLLARYPASALGALAVAPPDESLTRSVLALAPVMLRVPDDDLRNVNTPADLAAAADWLSRR